MENDKIPMDDDYGCNGDRKKARDAGCGCLIILGSLGLVAALSLACKSCDGPRSNYGGLPTNASPEGALDYVGRRLLGK